MKIFLLLYLIIIAGYGVTEVSILVKNRTFFSRKKKDPTAKLVIMPFILAIAGSPIEAHFIARPIIASIAFTGSLIALCGVFIRIKALLDLGKAFSMKVEIRTGQELVAKGLYATIRHPLYLASILIATGAPLI